MKSIMEFELGFIEELDKCNQLFDEGKVEEALQKYKEMMDNFEEPKVNQKLYYNLIEDLIENCVKIGKYDLASKYAPLLYISGRNRMKDGNKEYILGKLYDAQDEVEIAKQFFYISNLYSEGRSLKGKENKKYRDLIKGM